MAEPLPTVAELISGLGLAPHPEGGFFCETYRSPGTAGGRAHSTAIYFLLPAGHVSHLHRLTADEVWHHYLGGPLHVGEIRPDGTVTDTVVGPDLRRGQRPQHVVPAGHWFGSHPAEGVDYALVGCTVAPGFDFADFELGSRESLLRAFPGARELILKLT